MEGIIAVDVGTTGVKTAFVDRSGVILASSYAGYETNGRYQQVEQNPDDWWTATCDCLQNLREQLPSAHPAAIVLSGQMQDLILVNGRSPLHPAILYSDTRAQQEAKEVLATIGEQRLQEVTGNLQDASGLLAKLLWVKRHRPEVYRQARYLFVGAHDYIAWKLCGATATDFTTAATTGLLDIRANAWSETLLTALDLRMDWLPEIVLGETAVGEISPTISAETGFAVGTAVFHGVGDAAAATLGAGAGEPGRQYVYLGTSGWLAGTQIGDLADPESGIFNLRHPDPSRLIQIGPMLTAAGNFGWLNKQFGALELAANEGKSNDSHQLLNKLAEQAPAGSNGVIYLPYLAGERSPFRDQNARGVFFGLTTQTTRQEMYRAVLEGVAFAMRSIGAGMDAADKAGSSSLNLVGGGAKSPLWAQIFADVFNCQVDVLAEPDDVGTRGAALVAGKALGWYASYYPAPQFFPVQATYLPNPDRAALYSRLYPVFRELTLAMSHPFAALANALEQGEG